jgi:hypothetical protein
VKIQSINNQEFCVNQLGEGSAEPDPISEDVSKYDAATLINLSYYTPAVLYIVNSLSLIFVKMS